MENQTVSMQGNPTMKMHCPRCGGTHLMVQSNNRVVSSVSSAHKVGKKSAMGTTSYNTVNESFWFCQDCGMKFRDLDELLGLVAQYKKGQKTVAAFAVFAFVMAALVFAIGIGTVGWIFTVLGAAFVGLRFGFLRLAQKYQNEYDDLSAKVWKKV